MSTTTLIIVIVGIAGFLSLIAPIFFGVGVS
ncbi:unnamed protein product, partial [Rotaria sordida]